MNPNTCTVCELMFTKVMRARKVTINATVLFADLRGYTSLSQTLSPDRMAGLLDTFYDECGDAIWEYDGLLNKTIGDAVMAVFNFPIKHDDHAPRAVLAAREIQIRCTSKREELSGLGLSGAELAVGIGLHTGELSFGEFGRSHRDLTAIGTVVNIASRAQTVAQAGEILATKAVLDAAHLNREDLRHREYTLKGHATPVELYTM